MATVLVAGCGYVGTALAVRLARAGHVVHGLRREPRGLPAPVQPVAADLRDPTRLAAALPDGIELVAYTAAAAGPTAADYEDAYVRGPRALLAALSARGAPVRRILFTSSTGVYAQEGGQWVDESSPTEPTEPTAQRLLEGEQVFLAGPWPAVVLRLGGIYGPGRTRLVEDVRTGRARRPRDAPRFTNRIHRDDCAGALEHLLTVPAPPPLVLGVDHEPADLGVVLSWLAAQLGRPEPPLAEAVDASRGAGRGNKRCSNARLRATGYRFAFPTFREGYAALLRPAGDEPPPYDA